MTVAVLVLAVGLAVAGGGLVAATLARRSAVAAREQAVQSESRLSWALEEVDHAVVVVDEQGDVVYRNDGAAVYLGAGRDGAGAGLDEAMVGDAIRELAGDALRGRVAERELELSGRPRRTSVVRAAPLDDGARRLGALVVVEDTSERRRLEKVRRDFVANVSHELRTPVGALALLAETLMEEDDQAVARRLASRLAGEAFRVGRIVDDLLELSRLEIATDPLEHRVPVEAFVAEAVDRVQPAADRRDILVNVDKLPSHLAVVGDRRQLVSAVANLLDNAVKYSEPSSRVSVRVKARGGWVDVAVQDTGIGIPRRDLERIFERFYRVDRARARDTGGTGLGLAIVRHVASNHHGEVLVDSQEGAGSTFTLRLPSGGAAEAPPGPRSVGANGAVSPSPAVGSGRDADATQGVAGG